MDQKLANTAFDEAAREYAWKWYEYHAGQRQTVFRFFLILAAAIVGGYFTVLRGTNPQSFSFLFGLPLILLSFLFWRLDVRGRHLLEAAEDYLRRDEEHLAIELKNDAIRLSLDAHRRREKIRIPLSMFYTFKQIYATVFLIVALFGLVILLLDPTTPFILKRVGP